jgi:hypothetical protein
LLSDPHLVEDIKREGERVKRERVERERLGRKRERETRLLPSPKSNLLLLDHFVGLNGSDGCKPS